MDTYRVRILEEGFCLSTNLVPVGEEIQVSLPVRNYLVREGKAEEVAGDASTGEYARRDMQAEKIDKPKRRRRTKAEMEAARREDAEANVTEAR